MTLTPERARKVGVYLRALVVALNRLTEEDLEAVLSSISRDEALGPMIDPTRWRNGDLFGKAYDTRKVIQAVLILKKEVKGIGDFR